MAQLHAAQIVAGRLGLTVALQILLGVVEVQLARLFRMRKLAQLDQLVVAGGLRKVGQHGGPLPFEWAREIFVFVV